jgi:hypothetical protein
MLGSPFSCHLPTRAGFDCGEQDESNPTITTAETSLSHLRTELFISFLSLLCVFPKTARRRRTLSISDPAPVSAQHENKT